MTKVSVQFRTDLEKKKKKKDLIKGCQKEWPSLAGTVIQDVLWKDVQNGTLLFQRWRTGRGFLTNLGFLRVFKKIFLVAGRITRSMDKNHDQTCYYFELKKLKNQRTDIFVFKVSAWWNSSTRLGSMVWRRYFEPVEQSTASCRRGFYPYAQEGLTHKEIAVRLNITEGTSKWHLNSAREQLKTNWNVLCLIRISLIRRKWAGFRWAECWTGSCLKGKKAEKVRVYDLAPCR